MRWIMPRWPGWGDYWKAYTQVFHDAWVTPIARWCRDHRIAMSGHLLGEHGWWAKNKMPWYNELANTPLFIWDPRCGAAGERLDLRAQERLVAGAVDIAQRVEDLVQPLRQLYLRDPALGRLREAPQVEEQDLLRHRRHDQNRSHHLPEGAPPLGGLR